MYADCGAWRLIVSSLEISSEIHTLGIILELHIILEQLVITRSLLSRYYKVFIFFKAIIAF